MDWMIAHEAAKNGETNGRFILRVAGLDFLLNFAVFMTLKFIGTWGEIFELCWGPDSRASDHVFILMHKNWASTNKIHWKINHKCLKSGLFGHTTCVYDVFLISTAHMNQGTEVERLSENVPRRKMFIVSSRISPRSHVSKRFLTAALSPSYANSLNKTNARIKFSNSNLFVSAESIFYSAPSSKWSFRTSFLENGENIEE